MNPFVIDSIKNADLVILSMGSLYTSILPNLICKDITHTLDKYNQKIMYVANMMTQPGETDEFKISDHIKVLNSYLGNKKIDVVVANDGKIETEIAKKYETLEEKDKVELDENETKKQNVQIIKNNYVTIEDEIIRHDTDKLALDIYSYLLNYVD
ncbi:hypothetical protein EGP64_02670 [bacterium]|nr:hypothetical protein [bacterium]